MVVPWTADEIAGMRRDAYVHLGMRCNIERFQATGVDVDNQPTGQWNALYTDLACWYWERERSQYVIQEIVGLVNVEDAYPRMILPISDVTPKDRIAQVSLNGTVIASNLDIRTVLHRLYDTVLTIEAQT